MHAEARHFMDWVRLALPQCFAAGSRALDVGGGDINGNNRAYFEGCEYVANDVMAGPNVDLVCATAELAFPDGHFDTIVSTECFEHDMHYEASLRNILRMLRPGGLFAFTCATTGRPEHGTLRTSGQDSFTTQLGGAWSAYYKNLTEADVAAALGGLPQAFAAHAAYVNHQSHDLYFLGIKAPVAARDTPCRAVALPAFAFAE